MLHKARWKYRMQNDAKNRHLGTIAQLCPAASSQLRHVSTVGKIVNQQYLPQMFSQYGELLTDFSTFEFCPRLDVVYFTIRILIFTCWSLNFICIMYIQKIAGSWGSSPDPAGEVTTLPQPSKLDPQRLAKVALAPYVPDCGAQNMVSLANGGWNAACM